MTNHSLLIRVDGDSTIGLGHIYRGIAIAGILSDKFNVTFITRESGIHSPISDAGFKHIFIPGSVDYKDEPSWFSSNFIGENPIIILDGYKFCENYQSNLKKRGFTIAYIDDLASGVQKADIVINHSPGASEADYITENYTQLALGPDYALLRKPFLESIAKPRERNKSIQNILITFGGADPHNFTLKVAREIEKLKHIKHINILLGAAYSDSKIHELKDPRITIYQNVPANKLIAIMNDTDLAITAASTVSIELAALNVPTLLGYFVDNQTGIYNGFINKKAAIPLGDLRIKDFNELSQDIEYFEKEKQNLNQLFTTNPVRNIHKLFLKKCLNLRQVSYNDMEFVYNLSNEALVRKNSYNTDPISLENHITWFKNQIANNKSLYFILEDNGVPVGQIRFSENDKNSIIGVSISEKFRGNNFASIGLELSIEKYFEQMSKPIHAYIKKSNIASKKAFENAGFEYLKDEIVNGIDSYLFIRKK